MRGIELLEIKQTLGKARELAVEVGGFTLFYLIEMALLEATEMSKNTRLLKRDGSK